MELSEEERHQWRLSFVQYPNLVKNRIIKRRRQSEDTRKKEEEEEAEKEGVEAILPRHDGSTPSPIAINDGVDVAITPVAVGGIGIAVPGVLLLLLLLLPDQDDQDDRIHIDDVHDVREWR